MKHIGLKIAAVGLVLCLIGIGLNGFKFLKIDVLSSVKYVTKESVYNADTEVTSIEIDIDMADINFIPHNQDTVIVKYVLDEDDTVNMDVTNGKLLFEVKANRNFLKNIEPGINFGKPIIDIYYPKSKNFDSIKINTSLGDISFEGKEGLSVTDLNIITDLGDVEISDISASKIKIEADLGDIDLENTNVSMLNVDADMGDLNMSKTITDTIDVNLSFGDADLYDVSANNCNIDIEGDIRIEYSRGYELKKISSCNTKY